jgi:glycosyltransferase involved in cell wall biosynthesis
MTTRLMYILTIPQSALWYLKGQLAEMQTRGYQTSFVSSVGEKQELYEVGRREGVPVYPLEVSREIDLVSDLVSMWHLLLVMRRVRPEIVNFGNPKTGLIGGLVSWLLGVPVRIYTLHGLRLETATGTKRRILSLTERLTMFCAHRVVAVSPSLRERTLELGLVSANKLVTLNHGSVNGVRPLEADPDQVEQLRMELGLSAGAVVFGFVGRFTRDKGIRELVEAFTRLQEVHPGAVLLLVGDFEEGDPVDAQTRRQIQEAAGILWPGYTSDVTPYYGLMDVLVLPTYREGFPTVALEGASMGLPLITTDATGARDAVQDGVTGLQLKVGDVLGLYGAMERLLLDPGLRQQYGQNARARVVQEFSQGEIWQAWDTLYQTLLVKHRGSKLSRRHRLLQLAPVLIGTLALFWTAAGRKGQSLRKRSAPSDQEGTG